MAEKTNATVTFAVAFDIGTRTTGYALSHNKNPLLICAGLFDGSHVVEKAPTSVLVDDKKQFVAFGVKAEEMYAKLDKKSKSNGWALFRRFKEQLNNLENLNTHDTEIVDISQQISVPAITMFTMVIRYLKEIALKEIRSKPPILKMENIGEIQEDNIDYAITVPAFWHDSVRCMVRYAAFEAGIASDRLQLIPESDAATIWCHKDPDLMVPEIKKPGTKYIVVNMGDTKMEITAHQVTKRGNLKQLTKSVVTPFGGRIVDTQFLKFFKIIFGEETVEEFKTDHSVEYTEFVESFTNIKRKMTLEYSDKINIKLPAILCEINMTKTKDTGNNFREVVKAYDSYLVLVADKLRIDPQFIRSKIFAYCIGNLVDHIGEHCNIDESDYILCTGGFSNCKLILDVLAAEFPEKKIVCPKEGEFSVVKGAVIYRHRPGVFGREAKFTYGRSEHVLFDKESHSGHHSSVIGDEVWCTEVFRKYVTKGEEIPYDFEKTDYGLLPMEGLRLNATCSLYLSLKESPLYVSDSGCELVGDPFIHKFPHEQDLSNRKYDLTVRFLFDEIRVTFSHAKSGKTETKTFNFR